MITKKITKRGEGHQRKFNAHSFDEENALNELVKMRRKRSRGDQPAFTRASHRAANVLNAYLPQKAKTTSRHNADIQQLVRYLLEGNEGVEIRDRVRDIASQNMVFEDGKRLEAEELYECAQDMAETAALSTRIRSSAFLHYVVALPAIDKKFAQHRFWNAYVKEALAALSMEDHQALWVSHKDTESPHAHLVINKVHPLTGKVNDPSFDLVKFEELNRKFERRYGLQTTPGRWIDPATCKAYDWQKVKSGEIHIPRKRKNNTPAHMKKFAREVSEKLSGTKPFSTSQSWDELEKELRKHGLYLRAKGNGMVIESVDGDACKLTQVAGKGNGRTHLQKRFHMTWERYWKERYQSSHAITPDQRKAEYFAKRKRKQQENLAQIYEMTKPKKSLPSAEKTDHPPKQKASPLVTPQYKGVTIMQDKLQNTREPFRPCAISVGTDAGLMDEWLRARGFEHLKIIHMLKVDLIALKRRLSSADIKSCISHTSKALLEITEYLDRNRKDSHACAIDPVEKGLERSLAILSFPGEPHELELVLESGIPSENGSFVIEIDEDDEEQCRQQKERIRTTNSDLLQILLKIAYEADFMLRGTKKRTSEGAGKKRRIKAGITAIKQELTSRGEPHAPNPYTKKSRDNKWARGSR